MVAVRGPDTDDDEAVDAELEAKQVLDHAQPVQGCDRRRAVACWRRWRSRRPAMRVAGDDGFDRAVGVGGEDRQRWPPGRRTRTVWPGVLPNGPYQIMSMTAISTVSLRPSQSRRSTPAHGAVAAISRSMPPFAFQPRATAFAGAQQRGRVQGGVAGQPGGDRGTRRRAAAYRGRRRRRRCGCGGRETVGQQRDQLSGQPHRGVGALAARGTPSAPASTRRCPTNSSSSATIPAIIHRLPRPSASGHRGTVVGPESRRTPSAPPRSGCRRPPRRWPPSARRAAGPRSAEPASARSGRRPTRGGEEPAHRVKLRRPPQSTPASMPTTVRRPACAARHSQQREHRRTAAPKPRCRSARTRRVRSALWKH